MKLLAVLMPTYNYAHYLDVSISSILNQTFTDFDLYIYDDGSGDNTKEIVNKFRDKRIHYIVNEENIGLSRTLNKGLNYLTTRYKYIARMDADDWAHPERLEKQFFFMEKNPEIGLCGTQGNWVSNFEQPVFESWKYPTYNDDLELELLFSASFGHSSVLLRSDILLSNKLKYDISLQSTEDWDLWIKIAQVSKLANLSDFLMKYRIHQSSNHRSSDKIKRHFLERAKIIAAYWNKLTNVSKKNLFVTEEDILCLYYGKEMEIHSLQNKKKSLLKLIYHINVLCKNKAFNTYVIKRTNLQFLRILDFMELTLIEKYRYFTMLQKSNLTIFIKRYLLKLF